jgi:WD40 repeat protein
VDSRTEVRGWRSEEAPLALSFSPDGKRLAWAAPRRVTVCNPDGAEESGFDVPECERAVFSPDGRRVATARMNGAVSLWDVRTGEQVLTLDTPFRRVGGVTFSALTFSSDGRRLAASGLTTSPPPRLATLVWGAGPSAAEPAADP